MVELRSEVVISRPADAVFSFVSDFSNNPQWQPIIESKQITEGPIGVGTEFSQSFRVLGRTYRLIYEITEYERDRTLSFAYSSKPFSAKGTYTFQALDTSSPSEQTRLIASATMHLGGFFALGRPIFARQLKKQVGEQLLRLKKLLESV